MIEKQLEEINNNTKAILAAFLALSEKFVNVNNPPAVLLPKEVKIPREAKNVTPAPAEAAAAPETGSQKVVTRAQVGAALVAICEAAQSPEPGIAILSKFGCKDLASVPEAKYAELLAACEAGAKTSTSALFA